MDKKTIGIIGGMGPLATADLMRKIALHADVGTDQEHPRVCADVGTDQEHPRVCVDSNTDIPDRTAALLRGGADPVPEMVKSARRLESIGADVLIMPCNTAHGFYGQVASSVGIPMLHMIELTRDALSCRGIRRAGLLATDGTVETGIYQKTFAGGGTELLLPEAEDQAAVMAVIYEGVKAGVRDYDTAAFRRCCERLIARGAQTLILGCTELPPAFELYGLDYPATDPTLELALGALRFAGCKTKE